MQRRTIFFFTLNTILGFGFLTKSENTRKNFFSELINNFFYEPSILTKSSLYPIHFPKYSSDNINGETLTNFFS